MPKPTEATLRSAHARCGTSTDGKVAWLMARGSKSLRKRKREVEQTAPAVGSPRRKPAGP